MRTSLEEIRDRADRFPATLVACCCPEPDHNTSRQFRLQGRSLLIFLVANHGTRQPKNNLSGKSRKHVKNIKNEGKSGELSWLKNENSNKRETSETIDVPTAAALLLLSTIDKQAAACNDRAVISSWNFGADCSTTFLAGAFREYYLHWRWSQWSLFTHGVLRTSWFTCLDVGSPALVIKQPSVWVQQSTGGRNMPTIGDSRLDKRNSRSDEEYYEPDAEELEEERE